MNLKWTFLFIFLREVASQNANCDYYKKVNMGETFYIYSPNYPSNYSGALECRWIADCPSGFNCRLDCTDIMLPRSTACMLDRLLISKSGDPQLVDAGTYCGSGSLSVVSTRQRISVGLITPQNTRGGRFLCQVSAQPVTTNVNCVCGVRRQKRIVGGTETDVNEFPMMVGIVDTRTSQIKCGGVIISNWHVLTAALCVRDSRLADTAVVVGEHNVNTNDSAATKVYNVSNFNIHPQYNNSNDGYDIAIIKTANKIEFNDRVGPVCLPFRFQNANLTGTEVTILGWGTTSFGGPVSPALLKADLYVISQTKCMNQEPSVTNRQICAYTPGKDSCQMDSGGPLLYTDPRTSRLFSVGIIGSGDGCASDKPSVNTRVTSFLDWIVTNTGLSYCIK